MDVLEASGEKVDFRKVLAEGMQEVYNSEGGLVTGKEKTKIEPEAAQLLFDAPKGEKPIMSRVEEVELPDGTFAEVTVDAPGGIPFNALYERSPKEAREFKTNLRNRYVNYQEKDRGGFESLARGSARNIQHQLEAMDKSGQLGQANKDVGMYIAAQDEFDKVKNLSLNLNRKSELQQMIWPSRDTPAGIRRMISTAGAIRSATPKVNALARGTGKPLAANIASIGAISPRNLTETEYRNAMRIQAIPEDKRTEDEKLYFARITGY
jgi:hypothetical protein